MLHAALQHSPNRAITQHGYITLSAAIREVPSVYSYRQFDRQDNISFRTLILGFRSTRYYIVYLTRQQQCYLYQPHSPERYLAYSKSSLELQLVLLKYIYIEELPFGIPFRGSSFLICFQYYSTSLQSFLSTTRRSFTLAKRSI